MVRYVRITSSIKKKKKEDKKITREVRCSKRFFIQQQNVKTKEKAENSTEFQKRIAKKLIKC